MPDCPRCKGTRIRRNGHQNNGKQNYRCQSCLKQFVPDFKKKIISEETRKSIRNLLHERVSMRAICRHEDVSMPLLLKFIRSIAATPPSNLNAKTDTCQMTTIAIDEQFGFVGCKEKSSVALAGISSSNPAGTSDACRQARHKKRTDVA